jgi:hypothetical protein
MNEKIELVKNIKEKTAELNDLLHLAGDAYVRVDMDYSSRGFGKGPVGHLTVHAYDEILPRRTGDLSAPLR